MMKFVLDMIYNTVYILYNNRKYHSILRILNYYIIVNEILLDYYSVVMYLMK